MSFYQTVSDPCPTVNVAARQGETRQMRQLIQDGHPVDVMDNRGWRGTHEAAYGNHTQCLSILLQQEAVDVDWASFEGSTSLLVAAGQGNVESVKVLLDNKANPDMPDSMQTSPVMAAVKARSLECLKLLTKAGANVNAQNYCGTSPLHQAVSEGQVDIVPHLLKSGARLDIREEYGITPIFTAAHFGQQECLQMLLEEAKKRKQEYLVNFQAEDGGTPLYLAAQEGHWQCVKILLDNNGNPNMSVDDPILLPLHAALQFARLECVKLLLPVTDKRKLANCEVSIFDGCFNHEETEMTQYLLQQRVNPNERHKLNEGDEFEPKILRYVSHGVRFSCRVAPLTLLIMVHPDLVSVTQHAELLLRAGARPDASGRLEVPPILAAIDSCDIDFMKLLIRYGANLNVYHPNIIGNLSIIVSMRFPKGLYMLLKCGAETSSLFDKVPQISGGHQDDFHMGSLHSHSSLNYPSSDEEEGDSSRTRPPICLYETLTAARYLLSRSNFKISSLLKMILEFVCNVHIDPRIESLVDTKEEWQGITAFTGTPRSLMHCCRHVIRQSISHQSLLEEEKTINSLPLPLPIIEYIKYQSFRPG